MGYEGHSDHPRVEQLAALLELQRGAVLGQMRSHIPHGDRALQRGREAAAGDLTDLIALAIENQRALADWLAALDIEADAFLRRAILKLRDNAHGPRKAALGAAALVDGEGQPGHHRRGVEV